MEGTSAPGRFPTCVRNGLVGGATPRRRPSAREDSEGIARDVGGVPPALTPERPACRTRAGSPMPPSGLGPSVGALPKRVGEVEACSQARASQQGGRHAHRPMLVGTEVCRTQRQGGRGRGDTVRLSTRGTLRRVLARLGGSVSQRCFGTCLRGDARKVVNPRTGSRVQQTCRPCRGASRRGGEKPRGRNMRAVGFGSPNVALGRRGVDATGLERWRGDSIRTSREAGSLPRD